MRGRRNLGLLGSGLLALLLSAPSSATLIGDQVHGSWDTGFGNSFNPDTAIVNATSIEFINQDTGSACGGASSTTTTSLDVSGNSVTAQFHWSKSESSVACGGSFSLYVFEVTASDLDFSPSAQIVDVLASENGIGLQEFGPDSVTLVGGGQRVFFGTAAQTFELSGTFTFVTQTVPEPGTGILLGVGLAGISAGFRSPVSARRPTRRCS